MSEVVPHIRARGPSGKTRHYRELVTGLDFDSGHQPVLVEFENASKGRGTCLGCHDTPCMTLTAEDTALPNALGEFPGDPGTEVCPTRAITWNHVDEVATVDSDACIGCGLCVSRCPYGAISLIPEGVAVVQGSDPDALTLADPSDSSGIDHVKVERVGRIGRMLSPAARQFPEAIAHLNNQAGTRLVRNLLIECGITCRTRRPGDTNVRMDGVLATTDGRYGVLEIELGDAVMDSPRALLEDVAVLHGRYGIEVARIDPVSVVTELPNTRSEYFQVINDIENVLRLRCRTITVGALLAVLWQLAQIDGFVEDLFATTPDDTDLLPPMRNHVSESIPTSQPYPGAYRPSK